MEWQMVFALLVGAASTNVQELQFIAGNATIAQPLVAVNTQHHSDNEKVVDDGEGYGIAATFLSHRASNEDNFDNEANDDLNGTIARILKSNPKDKAAKRLEKLKEQAKQLWWKVKQADKIAEVAKQKLAMAEQNELDAYKVLKDRVDDRKLASKAMKAAKEGEKKAKEAALKAAKKAEREAEEAAMKAKKRGTRLAKYAKKKTQTAKSIAERAAIVAGKIKAMEEEVRCPTAVCLEPKPGCQYKESDEVKDNGCPKHPCGILVCRPFRCPTAACLEPKPGCQYKESDELMDNGCPKHPCGILVCRPFDCPTAVCPPAKTGCQYKESDELMDNGCPKHPCGICSGCPSCPQRRLLQSHGQDSVSVPSPSSTLLV